MNNIDFIQLNKLSSLHNNKDIFFCKTDFILDDFRYISKLDNNVIFISGNSDYPITDEIVFKAPRNIKKWFAQNAVSYYDILEPLPIGLENKIESRRFGHGIGYGDRVVETEKFLSRNTDVEPTKNIYANFNIKTNHIHRNTVRSCCINNSEIVWEEPILSQKQWFDTILEYKMVVCPAGNGIDTHRLWEVLYSNRIPITIRCGDYKIYILYECLPIIILDSVDDLQNTNLIISKYNQIINKSYNYHLLFANYWTSKILSYVK